MFCAFRVIIVNDYHEFTCATMLNRKKFVVVCNIVAVKYQKPVDPTGHCLMEVQYTFNVNAVQ
jgi:hypothetical protein